MGLLKKIKKSFRKLTKNKLFKALSYAALAAGAVYTGGALAGAMGGGLAGGVGAGAAGAAGGSAAAAGGAAALSSGTALTSIATAGLSGYQAGAQEEAQEKAMAEQARALREQEMTRKRALLAEMTSVSQRQGAARNVRNNLQGLSQNRLGGTTQQLGG